MDMLDPYNMYSEDSGGFGSDDLPFGASIMQDDSQNDQSLLGPPPKVILAKRFIQEVREKLDSIEKLLGDSNELNAEDVERLLLQNRGNGIDSKSKVIEGVFDGQHMMGSDGKQYVVPSNYASKSKLVEGDILKLTVVGDGSFVFKQIGPIDRSRVIGTLAKDEITGDFVVISDNKKWQVLHASVTFFHADAGDEAVILVPKNAPSRWAAMENVIKKIEAAMEKMEEKRN